MFLVFLQYRFTIFFLNSFHVWFGPHTFQEKSVLWQLGLIPRPLEGMSEETIPCNIYIVENLIIIKDEKEKIPAKVLVQWQLYLDAESVIDPVNGNRFIRIPEDGNKVIDKIYFLRDSVESFEFIFNPKICWEGKDASEVVAEFERLIAT